LCSLRRRLLGTNTAHAFGVGLQMFFGGGGRRETMAAGLGTKPPQSGGFNFSERACSKIKRCYNLNNKIQWILIQSLNGLETGRNLKSVSIRRSGFCIFGKKKFGGRLWELMWVLNKTAKMKLLNGLFWF
jgi:hypothetical protein